MFLGFSITDVPVVRAYRALSCVFGLDLIDEIVFRTFYCDYYPQPQPMCYGAGYSL